LARNERLLWKVRESSRWYREFGPYSVVDAITNCIIYRGLSREEVSALDL